MDRPTPPSLIIEFKRRAEAALPGRIARMVLFGSRARGDAKPDSDWDVAVFISGRPTLTDRRRLADVSFDLILESGEVVQPVALPASSLNDDLLFLRHIRNEGLVV